MVCSNCGSTCEDTDKFCNECGHAIISSSENLKSEEIEKADVFSSAIAKYSSNNTIKLDNTFNQKNGNYKSSYRDSNKRKKTPILIALILLIVAVVGLFIYVEKNSYSSKGKRTIMIYMIGSDLESKYLAATKDIDEIINSEVDFDDVNIIVYTGGAKKWHKSDIPNDKQALFEINEDGLVKIEEYDTSGDMLNYKNLVFLLEYGYNNYDTCYISF